MRSVFALLLLAAPLVAAPVPKALKKSPLDGTWEVTDQHSGGIKVNTRVIAAWVIDEKGGLTVQWNNQNAAVPIVRQADAATLSLVRPDGGAANALDYTISYAGGHTWSYPGVVELDGDTLKFFYATTGPNGVGDIERPTECKPDRCGMLCMFKRVSK